MESSDPSGGATTDPLGVSPVVDHPGTQTQASRQPRRRDLRWLFVVLIVLMLVIDQAIKAWCGARLTPGAWTNWPWPGVLELRLTFNKGIAFGAFQGLGSFFTPVALLIAGGAAWYSWTHPRESGWMHTAMALLAAGAMGNLYDRVKLGVVRDMFATVFMNFPVFNWADACITVATGILIVIWSKEAFENKGRESAIARPAVPAEADERP